MDAIYTPLRPIKIQQYSVQIEKERLDFPLSDQYKQSVPYRNNEANQCLFQPEQVNATGQF